MRRIEEEEKERKNEEIEMWKNITAFKASQSCTWFTVICLIGTHDCFPVDYKVSGCLDDRIIKS